MTLRSKTWALLGATLATALSLQLAGPAQADTAKKQAPTSERAPHERPDMGEPPLPLEAKLALNDEQAKLFEDLLNTARAYRYIDPVAMAKLTTPERISKMNALQQEQGKKLEAAVKKLYSALNAEQKKTFDATSSMLLMQEPGMGGHGPHGPRPGERNGKAGEPGNGEHAKGPGPDRREQRNPS